MYGEASLLFLCAVHLRKRKSEHGKLKPPSTSSITYWQIEKDKEPLSGTYCNDAL